MSHPFVERLIGTIRREYLDRICFGRLLIWSRSYRSSRITTIAIELTRRWMEKRQNRILNQSGMQALSPTHGVNIVVGYFTRQQPHDYEFAMNKRPRCPCRL